MIPVLLTITVTIGIILIGLLFFVLGKLNWLETATNSLLTKIDLAAPREKAQEIQFSNVKEVISVVSSNILKMKQITISLRFRRNIS